MGRTERKTALTCGMEEILMNETEYVKEMDTAAPKLSTKEAARILSNVFETCGKPQNTIPLEELEKKCKRMTESIRG